MRTLDCIIAVIAVLALAGVVTIYVMLAAALISELGSK